MRAMGILVLAAAGCATVQPVAVAPKDDPALIGALFRQARSIEQNLGPDFACLSLNDGAVARDPAPAIARSLAAEWKVPVFAGSQCRTDEAIGVIGPHGATGTGKWLRIINLTCTRADYCAADVGYYVGNIGSGARGVVAQRTAAGWTISLTGTGAIS